MVIDRVTFNARDHFIFQSTINMHVNFYLNIIQQWWPARRDSRTAQYINEHGRAEIKKRPY